MGTFKVGDTVKLKSGGPVMTVTARLDAEILTCKWFAGKKQEEGYFPDDSLARSKPPEDEDFNIA